MAISDQGSSLILCALNLFLTELISLNLIRALDHLIALALTILSQQTFLGLLISKYNMARGDVGLLLRRLLARQEVYAIRLLPLLVLIWEGDVGLVCLEPLVWHVALNRVGLVDVQQVRIVGATRQLRGAIELLDLLGFASALAGRVRLLDGVQVPLRRVALVQQLGIACVNDDARLVDVGLRPLLKSHLHLILDLLLRRIAWIDQIVPLVERAPLHRLVDAVA